MIRIKNSVIQLPAYEVPQQARIKLNQNESPYDIPEEYKIEILNRLKKISWNRYPAENPEDLKRQLSNYVDHPVEGIIIGNGSNELILASMLGTCDKGDRITVIRPGFAIYPYLAKILQLQIDEVPLNNNFRFDTKKLLKSVKNSKITFLATPNNPTGTTIDIDEIEEIVKIKKGIVVVDEAYYEFHGLTCQRLLSKYKNLLIVRTFSKAFGIAGIRLGYLLCNPDVAKHIAKAKPPFSVGIFQQVAGEYLLSKKRLVLDTVQKIVSEREVVFNQLNRISEIMPISSRANFILFGIKNYSSNGIFNRLYKMGVLVRKFNNPELKNMLRVTIGKPEENKEFIKILREIIKDPGGENAKF